MIQQHLLQQQRLNYNLDRLLERQNRLLTPKMSEFRPFGTSLLPGRNYDQHLARMPNNHHHKHSLAAQSRASIGSSSETYRFMGDESSEILPRNINSVVQHTRHHSMPLVHAEKFEPVQLYEHPVFGPTPAYIRPVHSGTRYLEDNYSDKDDDSEIEEHKSVQSHNTSLKTGQKSQPKTSLIIDKNNDDGNESDYAPVGYISYKKWKAKYEDLIPVNPLLFNIYTQRPNGSINSYGQSLYASSDRHRQISGDDDLLTTTLSDIGSISSEIPHGTSSSSHQKYHRLQPQSTPKTPTFRSLPPIHTGNKSDSSDDESSPPDSPVPYLSRNKQTPFPSTPLTTTTIPSTPIISPSIPTTVTQPTLNTSIANTTGVSSLPPLASINTSSIPPAPPMPSSLLTTSSNIPSAPPMPSSLLTTSSTIPNITPSSAPISSPPMAPPMPAFLTTSSSSNTYQSPSNISVAPPSSAPISSPPMAPPMPAFLTSSSSSNTYQSPSNISVALPSAPSLNGSSTKAVTFGGLSSFPVTNNNDVSSSSDSDDSGKQKRRRRRKRQAAAGAGGIIESSSSSD